MQDDHSYHYTIVTIGDDAKPHTIRIGGFLDDGRGARTGVQAFR